MGHSQAEKANSRARILKEAAEQIRDGGLESVSVHKLMRSVDLTHGGFYGHFASRSELLAQALERALLDGEAAARSAADPGKPRNFSTMIRSYLSRTHRDSRKTGCGVAALAADVGRADHNARAVMEVHIERFIAELKRALGTDDDKQAMVVMSAAVGALTLSRVMTDTKRSDALLRAVRDYLLAFENAK